SPFVHADSAQTRGVVDDGEVTSTTEIPLPPHSATQPTPQPLPPVAAAPEPTFVGVVPPSGRATTADDLDETTSNSPAPTPDSAQQPSAAPSNLAVEVTPEAQAATADQAEQVLVNADMAPGASPSRRHDELNPVTGNWTIALTPAGPATIVREPLAPQFELAPSVRVGNAPLEISGAVGGRTDETAAHRPVGTSPSVEISAELAQPEMQPVPPIVPVQSLQSMMARMPPSSTLVGDTTAEVGNAAQSNGAVDPYGPTDSYQFGDLGQLPPPAIAPVAPPAPTSANPHFNQFATPAQGLASRAFGAQPAHHDPRALTDGGTGFFQSEESAANRPRYQTTGANISLPEPRSRRVLYMAAGAFAVIAIAIIVFVALGGTASTKSTNPTGNGGSAQPLGSGSDQRVTHVDDHGSANTNAVDAPVVDAGAEPTLDAAATTAVGVDAAIDEPVPTSTLCTLNLNSEPTGAEVVSDKLMLGVTPFSIDVACGQPLPLKFRKAKWISISKTLKPTRKGVSFTARLLKPALSIRVISTPPGANVTLNGKAAGVTPATIKLAPGAAATIAVVKKGFVPAVKKHTAKANNELVNFTLVKSRTR
ncbi:MAG: PEGA domain-containing protein, partial [Kofleriaceae bacterium]|nr:PEGA domain-containing protein [Kofleriaceae bacterium]